MILLTMRSNTFKSWLKYIEVQLCTMVHRLIAACYLVARSDINLTHSIGVGFDSKSGKWLFVEFNAYQ